MKKIFLFAVMAALICAGKTAPAEMYLYDSDGYIYRLHHQINYPNSYHICFIATVELSFYTTADCLVFYKTDIGALKICVLTTALVDGWSYEGYWQGNGSYVQGIRNDSGYVSRIDTFLFIGSTH